MAVEKTRPPRAWTLPGSRQWTRGSGCVSSRRLTDQERREELGRDAAERQAERDRISAAALEGLQGAGVMEGEEMLVFDPETGAVLDPDEGELRRGLRLEEIERRFRSLRAGPVVLSLRDPDAPGGFRATSQGSSSRHSRTSAAAEWAAIRSSTS